MMAMIALATTMTAVLLTGSASSTIDHRVYLLQLRYVHSGETPNVLLGAWENITLPALELVKDAKFAVRMGYFGICVISDVGPWVCDNTERDWKS
jgi:hypothetical protein